MRSRTKRAPVRPLAVRLRRAFVVLLAATVSVTGAAWYVAGELVRPAHCSVTFGRTWLPLKHTSVVGDSGHRIAVSFAVSEPSKASILLLHPLRGNRSSMVTRAELLYRAGYSVVLADLQGHGESSGDAITFGFRERDDLPNLVDFTRSLSSHKSPTEPIGIIGQSLGGATAVLAGPLSIDALVLESVYPTIQEAVRNRTAQKIGPLKWIATPLLLCQLRLRLGFSAADLCPIEKLPLITCPTLMLHGALDRHTMLAEAELMALAAGEGGRLEVFPNAKHEDLLAADRQRYAGCVIEFFDDLFAPK